MADLLELAALPTGPAPLTYTLAELGTVQFDSAFAYYDGTSASGSFLPALTVRSQNGAIIARVFPSQTLLAGDKADVTYVPLGAETGGSSGALDTTDGTISVNPTTELFIGSGLALTDLGGGIARIDIASIYLLYMSHGPGGFWKLADPVGSTTAVDSSGNGYTLSAGGGTAPTFGAGAGPPGTTTADFTGKKNLLNASFPAQGGSSPFTAVAWVYYTDSDPATEYWIMGQGASAAGAFGQGWSLNIGGASTLYVHKLWLNVGNGARTDPTAIVSAGALTQNTWYFVAVTFDGTTWRMYINGVVEASTSTFLNTTQTGVLIGANQASPPTFFMDGRESWVAIFPSVLDAATLLSIYTLA